MFQRQLYKRLVEGIEIIKNDPKIIEQLFGELFELDREEVDKINTAFQTDPPNVIHGYTPVDSKFPLYSIVLANEKEIEHYLGDDAGMIEDPSDPDFGADRLSSLWDSTFQIFCYTEHPDLTAYYYEIAKSILITADFFSWGVLEYHFSGMDLAPDPRYIPEHLFVRQITMMAKYEFERVDLNSKLGKAFAVAGVHIDESGSPRDVGPVKTLVVPTPILDEEG